MCSGIETTVLRLCLCATDPVTCRAEKRLAHSFDCLSTSTHPSCTGHCLFLSPSVEWITRASTSMGVAAHQLGQRCVHARFGVRGLTRGTSFLLAQALHETQGGLGVEHSTAQRASIDRNYQTSRQSEMRGGSKDD